MANTDKDAFATFMKNTAKVKKKSKKGDDEEGPKGSALARLERVLKYIEKKEAVIDINHLLIGNIGARMLAEPLVQHNKLKELHLPGCGIGDNGIMCIADSLGQISGLVVLRLLKNKIGPAGAKALAKSLIRHRLTFLELSHNNIGDDGALSMAETLKQHKGLTWLGLDNNEISDVGAKALSEAVGSGNHDKLYWLGMDGNLISEEGSVSLSKAMEKHKDLNFLWLSNNLIGDKGAASLAENLGGHGELRWLGLEGNDDILETGTARLMESIPPRTGIEWIDQKCRIRAPDWRPPPRKEVDMLELLNDERPPHLRKPKRVPPEDEAPQNDVSSQKPSTGAHSREPNLAGFAAAEAVRADRG